jgi:hypothetical protein
MKGGRCLWGLRCIHQVIMDRKQILRVLRAWTKNESFVYFPEHLLHNCSQVAGLSFLDFSILICKMEQIMFCFLVVKIK